MIQLELGPDKKKFEFSACDHKGFLKREPNNLKIGILFSGGLDSLVLLCLVLSDLKRENLLGKIPVYCYYVVKRISTKKYAIDLIDRVKKHFDCNIRFVKDVPNECEAYMNNDLSAVSMHSVKISEKDMIVYAAINMPPKNEIDPYFGKKSKINNADMIVTRNYIAPFLPLQKNEIIDMAHKIGCEWLLPYTHSCWKQEEGKCNECFACRERRWGFESLGIDPDS